MLSELEDLGLTENTLITASTHTSWSPGGRISLASTPSASRPGRPSTGHRLGIRFAELQVKVVMHQLVQRFRFEAPDGYRMPVQQARSRSPEAHRR